LCRRIVEENIVWHFTKSLLIKISKKSVPSPKELTQLSIESKQQTPTNKKAKGSKK